MQCRAKNAADPLDHEEGEPDPRHSNFGSELWENFIPSNDVCHVTGVTAGAKLGIDAYS